MRFNKSLLLTLCAAVMMTVGATAQKFGHINTQQLLLESPSVKSADTQIQTFQTELMGKGEGMMKTFEANVTKYREEVAAGLLNKLQMQKKEAELQTESENIRKYEQEMQQKMMIKREELYAPILDKVRVALEEIGKAEGYTMIFDTSVGGTLYAVESEDLLTKVKTKLGW